MVEDYTPETVIDALKTAVEDLGIEYEMWSQTKAERHKQECQKLMLQIYSLMGLILMSISQ